MSLSLAHLGGLLTGMCLAQFSAPNKHSQDICSFSDYGMLFQASREKETLLARGQFLKKGGWGSNSEPFAALHRVLPPHIKQRIGSFLTLILIVFSQVNKALLVRGGHDPLHPF